MSDQPYGTWTSEKEQKLRHLRRQVAELEAERVLAVERVECLAAELGLPQGINERAFARRMIELADVVRDALGPFDCGKSLGV